MAKASKTAIKMAMKARTVKEIKTAGKKTAGSKTAGSKKSMKAMKAKNAKDEMFHVRIPVKSKVDHVWIHTNLG
jgi:hypothetical protein